MTYHELYNLAKQDSVFHVNSGQIANLLNRGYTVESRVLGRFGYINGVDPHDGCVSLRSTKNERSKHYCTWFHDGDPVELRMSDEPKTAILATPEWAAMGLFRGNEEADQEAIKLFEAHRRHGIRLQAS